MRIFIIFLFVALGIVEQNFAGCDTCGKNRLRKQNSINDFPYIIRKSGRFYLEHDLVQSIPDDNEAVIMIEADNVTLDLNDKTINLRNNNLAAIIVESSHRNIRIFNGRILNTGYPKSVPYSTDGYQSPFSNNSLCGIGIALKSGSENVYIEDITFVNNFIAIAGYDQIKRISIRNCEGHDCGHRYSQQKVGSSNHRGGFIIFAPSQETDAWASESVKISLCKADSNSAQFGIAILNGKHITVEDSIMSINSTNEGNPYSESSGISAIGCHQVHFKNLIGQGLSGNIQTHLCSSEEIINCYKEKQ